MAHAENSITINKPVKAVFDLLVDGMNNPLWRGSSVADIALIRGNAGEVGAVYKQGLKGPGGRRFDGDYELVDVRPNARIEFRVIAGPARPTGVYEIEDAGGSTRVKFVLDFKPKGFARLMDGMITSTMRGEVGTLSDLKAYLEKQR